MLRTINAYARLLRGYTLIPAFLAGVLGGLASYRHHGIDPDWTSLSLAGLSLALAQAGGQAVNQATDVEADRVNKPYRPVASGAISAESAVGAGVMLSILSMSLAVWVSPLFLSFVALLVFMAVFYSLEPLDVKSRNEWLSLAWISVSRGYLAFLASWSVAGDPLDPVAQKVAVVMLMYFLSWQPTKDLGDVEGDRVAGIKTLATRYGVGNTVAYMISMGYATSLVSVIVAPALGFVDIVLTLALTYVLVRSRGRFDHSRIRLVENNPAWRLFYAGVGLMYLTAYLTIGLYGG